MNRAERRRQQKRSKAKSKAKPPVPAVVQSNVALERGVALHQAGQLDQAIHWYQEVLKVEPDNAAALSNTGYALFDQGKLDAAIICFRKALSVKPDYPEAYYNLGNALKSQGQLDEAIACWERALTYRPAFPEALNNCGNTLLSKECYDEAVAKLTKAIALKPDFAEAYNNLGNVLTKQGKLEESMLCLQKAISINPDSFYSFDNLGNVLKDQGKLHEAATSYLRGIAIRPDFANSIDNLAFTLESACFDVIDGHFDRADIAQIIDYIPEPVAANGGKYQQQAILKLDADKDYEGCNSVELAIVKTRVKKIVGENILQERQEVMNRLPTVAFETISNDRQLAAPAIIGVDKSGSKNMVAMLGLASAATGLFHSLLDGHPEISILPGVYMSGYFGRGVWQKIVKQGYSGTATQFADLYRVLFDARNQQKPPPPHLADTFGLDIGVGVAEGYDKLGENHDTPLQLDRSGFLANLEQILATQESINHGSFFEHIHHAYEKSLGNDFSQKKVLLHHLHKYEFFSMSNMLKNFPAAKLLTIIRNPVQGCESWANRAINNKFISNGYRRYFDTIGRLTITLRDINSVEFSLQDSVGIRVEDIKQKPQETMQRLAAWLGVEYSPTLHEATIQGLKWWGDPGSSLFGKTQTADYGKSEPIRRKLGMVFSEQDLYILETLFYPLNARFGYVENNQSRFKKDLQAIRKLVDKPLDFELKAAQEFPDGYPELENSSEYKTFHTMLLGRWRILDEFGTYPDMFKPLPE